jgi:hypothetical protein
MKISKYVLTLLLMCLGFPVLVISQSTIIAQWYISGLPTNWYYQKDVFAFKTISGNDYTGYLDTNIVDKKIYWSDSRTKAVEIYFKATATPNDVFTQIQSISLSGQIEFFYPIITKDTNLLGNEQKWRMADDLLLVTFENAFLSDASIDSFALAWGLDRFYTPSPLLPSGGRYTYVFKINSDGGVSSSASDFISVAKQAYLQNIGFVKEATPNLSISMPCGEVDSNNLVFKTYSNLATCPTNDPNFNDEWNIENLGFQSSFSSNNSLVGADANICGCWAQGLTGQGIRIGVMSAGDFGMVHPDIGSQITQAYDCFSGPCSVVLQQPYPTGIGSTLFTVFSGQQIVGISAAKSNNSYGIAGITSNASTYVYQIGYMNPILTSDIVAAFHQALLDNVHLLTLNFYYTVQDPIISNEINNHRQFGRVINESSFGTIIIASSGTYLDDIGYTVATTYPAAEIFDNVIGVIPSNPEDEIVTKYDGWQVTLAGSTTDRQYNVYCGFGFDIAAPSVSLPFPAAVGYGPPYQITIRDDGSAMECSLGTVTGIAALLLESNPLISCNDFQNIIRNGAEKVTYSYINGQSTEFSYGRINCGNSLNMMSTAIFPTNTDAKFLWHREDDKIVITHKEVNKNEICNIALIDITGRVMREESFTNMDIFTLNNINIPSGVYMIRLLEGTTKYSTWKIIW